ncbi:MAG: hypothetical protein ACTHKE_08025 [Sphingomicrobium sp.]|jgi:hypothetical protein
MVERFRHPELVSGSIFPPAQPLPEWMLKQVQHDEGVSDEMLSYSSRNVHDAFMTILEPHFERLFSPASRAGARARALESKLSNLSGARP